MNLKYLNKLTSGFLKTDPLPVLFFGHGSPMNAIENNLFTKGWKDSIKNLRVPSAILCISAHWETNGTFVTAMKQPKTIHDFGGFPPELFAVEYPAPGSPELAEEIVKSVQQANINLDEKWGLDHGSWSVLKHLYPDANIPVLQLSLDRTQSPSYHLKLAKELADMRKRGVLIIGSGNMVHNLSMIDWNKPEQGFDWAEEANRQMKKLILANETKRLADFSKLGREFQLSIPTSEHFLPLLYTLGLKQKDEKISFFNEQLVMGSISMSSLKIEKN